MIPIIVGVLESNPKGFGKETTGGPGKDYDYETIVINKNIEKSFD